MALKKNSENNEPLFSYQPLPAGVGGGGAHITHFCAQGRWPEVAGCGVITTGTPRREPGLTKHENRRRKPVMWINEEQVMKGLQTTGKTLEAQQSRAGSPL